MSLKLSIIIPCYNCAQTLRESVDSCYVQGLETTEFEIVMVDDGSSDGTRALMQTLATEHDNIHLMYHEQNKGGGAARNTGIRSSHGDIIYCLDSDNLFATNSVQPMLDYLQETNADGVAFYERRFFFGTHLTKYTTHINRITDRIITLLDLFNESNTLLDNFFYTRTAYNKTAGYPEQHGFDTQCFEMRYLVAGNTVRVQPHSFFYHRQGMKERSYFERVHASGMFSVNYILMYEEMFHLFTPELQKLLISFPLFSHTRSYGENLLNLVKNKVINNEPVFISNYYDYLTPDSAAHWLVQNPVTTSTVKLEHIYHHIFHNDYPAAQILFATYIQENKTITPYLQFLALRIVHGLAGIPQNRVIATTFTNMRTIELKPITTPGGQLGELLRKSLFLRYVREMLRKK